MPVMTKINLKCRLPLLLLLLCSSSFLHSQSLDYKRTTINNIAPVGEFVPDRAAEEFKAVLQAREMPYPHQEMKREKVRALKALESQSLPVVNHPPQFDLSKQVTLLDSFPGNAYSASVPNDDAFAISRDGIVLSMRNSTIGAYLAQTGTQLFESSLFRFYRPRPLLPPGSKYDPRVIYDPKADRFIVLYLNGNIYQNSVIVLGFSKTNDPQDGFNIYQLDGNPLNDSTWSDYPHISITENDLLITMNTFYNGSTNNSGYVQSTLRQLSKNAGYDSLPLTEHYYSDISVQGRNLFNFTGATGGSQLYGPEAYFLGSRNLNARNDSIFLLTISDSAKGNPSLGLRIYRTENEYGLPPDARQPNNHRFDCNDARIQGAFLENDLIQFVGNTMTADSNSGIYHGIIDLNAPVSEPIFFKNIGFDSIDVGYPQITYSGQSTSDNEAIITLNYTSDSLFPGFGAIFFNHDSLYGPLQLLTRGAGFVDIISNGAGDQFYERWGDYTGAQRMYNERGIVWASGYDPDTRGIPGTVIVKLRSPNYNQAPISLAEQSTTEPSRVAPNPFDNFFRTEIDLPEAQLLRFQLTTLDGRKAKLFDIEEYAEKGGNEFRFSTGHLSSGMYLLQVWGAQGDVLLQEKIVKP